MWTPAAGHSSSSSSSAYFSADSAFRNAGAVPFHLLDCLGDLTFEDSAAKSPVQSSPAAVPVAIPNIIVHTSSTSTNTNNSNNNHSSIPTSTISATSTSYSTNTSTAAEFVARTPSTPRLTTGATTTATTASFEHARHVHSHNQPNASLTSSAAFTDISAVMAAEHDSHDMSLSAPWDISVCHTPPPQVHFVSLRMSKNCSVPN